MVLNIALGIILALVILALLPLLLWISRVAIPFLVIAGIAALLIWVVADNPETILIAFFVVVLSFPVLLFIFLKARVSTLGSLQNTIDFYRLKFTPVFSDIEIINKERKLEIIREKGRAISERVHLNAKSKLKAKVRELENLMCRTFSTFIDEGIISVKSTYSTEREYAFEGYRDCVYVEAKNGRVIATAWVISIPRTENRSDILILYCDSDEKPNYDTKARTDAHGIRFLRKKLVRWLKLNPSTL